LRRVGALLFGLKASVIVWRVLSCCSAFWALTSIVLVSWTRAENLPGNFASSVRPRRNRAASPHEATNVKEDNIAVRCEHRRGSAGRTEGEEGTETFAAGALLRFCVLQILLVVSASSLFTSCETSHYRCSIEPCIWVVVVAGLKAASLAGSTFPFRS
jgi:hypothetical protein